jgi:hypothetical protein
MTYNPDSEDQQDRGEMPKGCAFSRKGRTGVTGEEPATRSPLTAPRQSRSYGGRSSKARSSARSSRTLKRLG